MAVRKIKLGVFIDQRLHAGGGYQQSLNAAVLASQLNSDDNSLFFFTTVAENIDVLRALGIEAVYLRLSFFHRVTLKLRQWIHRPGILRLIRKVFGDNYFEGFLVQNGVDLVYFTSPSAQAISLERMNYIFTVWDLCHRDDPEFPEVRGDREFETREWLYRQTLTKAVAVIVDSAEGRRNVIRRYAVEENRAHVISFSPASGIHVTEAKYEAEFVDVKAKYCLATDYVFYPAQFWAHKNHVYLLRGLKLLEDRHGVRLGAIFAGVDVGGNLKHVKRVADEIGLSDRVRYAGFVPNVEMPYLYRQSVSLVMPSYFGPTNLPPLEAFCLGVPVLYPNKAGLIEQVGDAALLMDLQNPASLADHLAKLIEDEGLRNEMIAKGKSHFSSICNEDRSGVLFGILREFSARRACWD